RDVVQRAGDDLRPRLPRPGDRDRVVRPVPTPRISHATPPDGPATVSATSCFVKRRAALYDSGKSREACVTSQRRRGGKHRLTMEDVAREAQVSAMTVSRYLRAPDSVREDLGKRVAAAIARTGY